MKTPPAEWEIEYDNDTGPGDDAFAEWFTIGPLRYAKDRNESYGEAQAFAEKVKRAMVCHDDLLKWAKAYRNDCFNNAMRNNPSADWIAFVRELDELIAKAIAHGGGKEAAQ